MIEGIADDRVFFAKQGFKNAPVGVKGCSVENAVFGAVEMRNGRFEILVNALCPTDKAH